MKKVLVTGGTVFVSRFIARSVCLVGNAELLDVRSSAKDANKRKNFFIIL